VTGLSRDPYDFKQVIQDEEKRRINSAMELCRFNQKNTAEFLGMTYHQLRGYLRKYELTEGED
jgi:psp operon transcriptional activator